VFKREEKTGHTQAAIAALVTSGALGVLPFFDIDIDVTQATNLGLFVAAVVYFVARQVVKARL